MTAARILAALADLAPAAKPSSLWATIGGKAAWDGGMGAVPDAEELAAHDELHRDERSLRQGFGIVMGRTEINGVRQKVAAALVTRPVRLVRAQARPFDFKIVPAGDVAVHPLLEGTEFGDRLAGIFDPERRAGLLDDPEWLAEAARRVGYEVTGVEVRGVSRDGDSVVLARPVVYVNGATDDTPIAKSLKKWAEREGIEDTALAAVYAAASDLDAETEDAAPPRCPLPLSREQAAAVMLGRRAPVTVVTGAPGCGKSHTLAAIALDAIASGQSVLIATQSVHAADVLGALLDRHPGPTPIQFGDSESRGELNVFDGKETSKKEVERSARAAADAEAHQGRIEAEIATWLDLEHRRARAQDAPLFLLDDFPLLRDADLDEVERIAALAHSDGRGLWRRLRRHFARRHLTAAAGAVSTPDSLRRAVEIARDVQATVKLAANGGLDLDPLWRGLEAADRESAAAVGTALRLQAGSSERWSREARNAFSTLDYAMRKADPVYRRELLGRIDAASMVALAPLWIGTVADVEAVLPPHAGLFDLVILDEASHINQLRAAPVLARARRAVVAGDPKQLRFVSFAGEDRLRGVLERHDLWEREAQLDTGRVSAYDLARGAGPVVELTEHHRSVPHLIGFSAAKFYRGRVKPITTHPRNHEADAITVHRVSAKRANDKGVIKAEVDAAVDLLAELIESGHRSLAVLSPFRAQAEAVEAAIVKRFDLETIRGRKIRSGTVHAFQGSEAETVIAALGAADGDPAGRRRFLSGPNLFNVMVTRAREHLHVVTALTDPPGLVGEFLAYADRPPRSPEGEGPAGEWGVKLADALAGGEALVRSAYPVGHWSVDLVVGEGENALGVICAVHPEGPRAHLARHRALRRAGWRLVDAFPSTFDEDPSRAAVAILADLDRA